MIEYLQILGQEVYKIIFLLIPILVSVAMIVWLDRRVWGLVQKRRGPNVVGPFGLLQTLADALKYFLSVLKSEQGILVILVVFSNLDIGFLLVQ